MAQSTLVLLVLNDPLTGLLTESGLRSYGYDVVLARSSAEGQDLVLTNKRIKALVVDADLAGGLALARAARSASPGMHVVYTSQTPNKVADREKVRGAPCLRVPYHPHQLVGVIGGLMRRPTADGSEPQVA